jgi:hypothetical protein
MKEAKIPSAKDAARGYSTDSTFDFETNPYADTDTMPKDFNSDRVPHAPGHRSRAEQEADTSYLPRRPEE